MTMKTLSAYTSRLGNRSSNQDRCLVLEKHGRVLLVVADGMGGHARGDLAAQTAINSLTRSFITQPDYIPDPQSFLRSALQAAHLEVVEAGNGTNPPVEPRTTCVVCLVQHNSACWAHLGDSRLYLLRGGSLVTRTRDHTPVEGLLQNGVISEDDLRTHPLRNSVSRCLGGALSFPKITFDDAELKPDDTLLLCSDGLWSALADEQLTTLPAYGNLDTMVNRLVEEAEMNSYPHSDNISLVALRWLSAGPACQSTPEPCPPANRKPSAPAERAEQSDKDPLQLAIDDIHRAMLDYASEMKK